MNQHKAECYRRVNLMARSRTPLGHYWHQKQLVAALKAMIMGDSPVSEREPDRGNPQMTIDRCALCGTPITTAALCDKCGRKA